MSHSSIFPFPFHDLSQLELITDLLGTPSMEDMKYACDGAKSHMLRRPIKRDSLCALYSLSNQANQDAVHLLREMLVFNPVSVHHLLHLFLLLTL